MSARAWALGSATVLLTVGGSLMVVAPAVSRYSREVAIAGRAPSSGAWALGVLAIGGLALGGAVLTFVLARLARDVEVQPYASLAPVLAAFSACVLIGLNAPLPLPGIAAEQLGVFALAAAVIGGALVRADGVLPQLAGLVLALFPALSLVVIVWAASGQSDVVLALASLAPRALAFLGMLVVSSFVIAVLAVLGRSRVGGGAERSSDARTLALSDDPPAGGPASIATSRLPLSQLGADGPSWRGAFLAAVALVLSFGALQVALSARDQASLGAVRTQDPVQLEPPALSPEPSVDVGASEATSAESDGGASGPGGIELAPGAAALAPVVFPAAAPTTAAAARPSGAVRTGVVSTPRTKAWRAKQARARARLAGKRKLWETSSGRAAARKAASRSAPKKAGSAPNVGTSAKPALQKPPAAPGKKPPSKPAKRARDEDASLDELMRDVLRKD